MFILNYAGAKLKLNNNCLPKDRRFIAIVTEEKLYF